MITIKDNNITMIKGDTAYISVALDNYVYKTGDTLTLTVKEDINDETAKLSKVIAANSSFVLYPEDTEELEAGRYVYDVQLDTALEEVFTVVVPSQFVLREGVNNG